MCNVHGPWYSELVVKERGLAMNAVQSAPNPGSDLALSDQEVVDRVLAGETELYEIIMRRYNQRLFRVARAVLRNDDEAEQVMQDAYVSAYMHLAQFEGRARFSTWLTRIAFHEALARLRRARHFVDLDSIAASPREQETLMISPERNPEQKVYDQELKSVLEHSLDALPEHYRSVFALREIEGLDTAETSECLGISQESVKVRLHRARGLLRRHLYDQSGGVIRDAYQFHLVRCNRVVEAVLRRIRDGRVS